MGLEFISKSSLLVYRRFSHLVWMIGMFDDWFKEDFCPEIKKYSIRQNITCWTLPLVSNDQSHVSCIAHPDEYVTSSSTYLIQLLDLKVISTFNGQIFNVLSAAMENPELEITVWHLEILYHHRCHQSAWQISRSLLEGLSRVNSQFWSLGKGSSGALRRNWEWCGRSGGTVEIAWWQRFWEPPPRWCLGSRALSQGVGALC